MIGIYIISFICIMVGTIIIGSFLRGLIIDIIESFKCGEYMLTLFLIMVLLLLIGLVLCLFGI